MSKHKEHPAASLFPKMSESEFESLKADIRENGQRDPVIFHREMLLDGRHRMRACTELGIECDAYELDDGDDPYSYSISINLHRRHLTTGQRSMVAGRMATLKKGDNQHTKEGLPNGGPSSVDESASLLKVSPRSVERAKEVISKGSRDVIEAVEQNAITLASAAKLVKAVESKRKQSEIVKEGKKAVAEFSKVRPKSKATRPESNEDSDDLELDYLDDFLHVFRMDDNRLDIVRRIIKELEVEDVTALCLWLNGE